MRRRSSKGRWNLAIPSCLAHRFARTTDNAGDDLRCVQQGLRCQMGIPLGHLGRGVPQQPLHHVERDALVHQETRKRVAQVVDADVSQSCAAPHAVPGIEQADKSRRKYKRAQRITRDGPEQRKRGCVEGDRTSTGISVSCWCLSPSRADPGSGDLTTPRSGEEREHDCLGGGSVLILGNGGNEALRLFLAQKPLALDFACKGDPCDWVRVYPNYIPFPGEIEQVAQNQDAIGGTSSVAPSFHVVDKAHDLLARDLVEWQTPQLRQDVNPQKPFIGVPTGLACPRVGQIAIADELLERRKGPQFLAVGLGIGAKLEAW